MSDIFLGYSRTDSQVADRLEQRLKAEGWSVHRDVQTDVGRRGHREIEKELHAARAVVVLWSDKSRDSDYLLKEAEYRKRNEILFPAFIERVDSPYGFGRIQTADLIGWSGEKNHPGLTQSLESLKVHLHDPGSLELQITAPSPIPGRQTEGRTPGTGPDLARSAQSRCRRPSDGRHSRGPVHDGIAPGRTRKTSA